MVNKNLEQQAEALFKAWFLDYIPWNGNVPSSWIDGKLGNFADIKRGGSPRPIQKYLSNSGLRWLKISDVTSLQTPFVIDIKDHIIEDGLKKTVLLKEGSLVLSNRQLLAYLKFLMLIAAFMTGGFTSLNQSFHGNIYICISSIFVSNWSTSAMEVFLII